MHKTRLLFLCIVGLLWNSPENAMERTKCRCPDDAANERAFSFIIFTNSIVCMAFKFNIPHIAYDLVFEYFVLRQARLLCALSRVLTINAITIRVRKT